MVASYLCPSRLLLVVILATTAIGSACENRPEADLAEPMEADLSETTEITEAAEADIAEITKITEAADADAADPTAARREAAIRHGTTWLFDNADDMGAQWALSIFSRLERLTTDPELAAACREIVEERSRAPVVQLPDVLPPGVVQPRSLRATLAELRRRKRIGEPYQAWVNQLDGLLRRHGARSWARLRLTQQLVLVHQLSEFGLDPPRTLDDIIEEIRTRWREGDADALVADRQFMFALTHVFTTASGYFSHYPDPDRFGPEIGMLRYALQRYLREGIPDHHFFLDVQAEVITAGKLLQLPEDELVLAMYERLLDAQNDDGSWGQEVGLHREHATSVVLQALVEYPPSLGGGLVPDRAGAIDHR